MYKPSLCPLSFFHYLTMYNIIHVMNVDILQRHISTLISHSYKIMGVRMHLHAKRTTTIQAPADRLRVINLKKI